MSLIDRVSQAAVDLPALSGAPVSLIGWARRCSGNVRPVLARGASAVPIPGRPVRNIGTESGAKGDTQARRARLGAQQVMLVADQE